jgi:hypothetical protein
LVQVELGKVELAILLEILAPILFLARLHLQAVVVLEAIMQMVLMVVLGGVVVDGAIQVVLAIHLA